MAATLRQLYQDLDEFPAALLIIIIFLSGLASRGVSYILFKADIPVFDQAIAISSMFASSFSLTLFLLGAAFMEEFIFRVGSYNLVSLLHKIFKARYLPYWLVIGITVSFLFGILHTNYPLHFRVIQGLTGLLLFAIYTKSSQAFGQPIAFVLTSLIHFSFNFSAFLLFFLVS